MGIHLKQQLKDKLIEHTQYISKEEQRKRFLQRIDAPDKLWKVSQADVVERTFWKQYMMGYPTLTHARQSELRAIRRRLAK